MPAAVSAGHPSSGDPPARNATAWALATFGALPMPILLLWTVLLLPIPVSWPYRPWACAAVWLLLGAALSRASTARWSGLGMGMVAGTAACLPWLVLIAAGVA